MLVKKNLQPYVLPKSTYTDLWVQVNTGCGVMHVVSVYLPNKNMSQVEKVREELTKKIQNHIAKFPNTPLILMGDFNLHPKQMEKWVSTLGREMVLAKQAIPCNTYPKDGTTLDYVVYRRIPGFRCESVVVDTQNEISDHRIIKTAVRIPVVKKPQTRFVLDREKKSASSSTATASSVLPIPHSRNGMTLPRCCSSTTPFGTRCTPSSTSSRWVLRSITEPITCCTTPRD